MKKIGDMSAVVLMFFVALLGATTILAVWEVLDRDVIYKSLWTIGVLAFADVIVIISIHFSEKTYDGGGAPARIINNSSDLNNNQ